MLQFGDTWEEFYMSHWKTEKRWGCASLINFFVWFKWQATTQTQLTQPANHPPSKKSPRRMPGLKAVLKVKPVSGITVPFVSFSWGKELFNTYMVKPLSRLQWYTAKSTKKKHLVSIVFTGLYSEFWWEKYLSESVTSLQKWDKKVRISCYLPKWISFLSCKAQRGMNGRKERNDSIPSVEECQDPGYTKGKEKTRKYSFADRSLNSSSLSFSTL